MKINNAEGRKVKISFDLGKNGGQRPSSLSSRSIIVVSWQAGR